HGIAADDCLLMGVGHFESPYRFVDALSAFDIVRGVEESLKMILIGEGPFRERTPNVFYYPSRKIGFQVIPARPDAAPLLPAADVVVIGHRRRGGVHAVLEGMAAGRPVVATRLPHIAGYIRDSETGFLVPPANTPAMARILRRLIREAPLRCQIGAAARSE